MGLFDLRVTTCGRPVAPAWQAGKRALLLTLKAQSALPQQAVQRFGMEFGYSLAKRCYTYLYLCVKC